METMKSLMAGRAMKIALGCSLLLGFVFGEEPKLALRAELEQPLILPGTRQAHVLVRLRADKAEAEAGPRSLNLALVVDRSGSMKGAKIADARDAAVQMVDRMRDGDRVALISYSDEVRVDAVSTVLNETTRAEVIRAIHAITDGGSTNLGGGLVEGLSQVRSNRGDAEVNRVLLLSDGLANRGIQEPKELSRIAREALQEGVITTTIGLGADYNEDLMTAVADHGGGNYFFVEDSGRIVETLNDELRQMASTVAKSVSLHLTMPEQVALTKVHGWIPREEGELVIVPLGEFFSGQLRSVLWQFELPENLEPGDELVLGPVELAYKGVGSEGELRRVASDPLTIRVTGEEDAVAEAQNGEVTARIAEIELAMSMESAAVLVAQGRYDEARATLASGVARAREQGARLPAAMAEELFSAADAADRLQVQVTEAEGSAQAAKVFSKGGKAEAQKLQKK